MAQIKIKATFQAFFSQASTRMAETITCNDSNAKKQHSLQNIALTLITSSRTYFEVTHASAYHSYHFHL